MDIINYTKGIFRSFFVICSGVTVGTGVYLKIYNVENVESSLIWQIVIVALLATLVGFVKYSKKELGRDAYLIRSGIHYLLINVLLLSSAYYYKWFTFQSINKIFIYAAIILMVYIMVCLSMYIADSAKAKKLNEKLREFKNKRSDDIE